MTWQPNENSPERLDPRNVEGTPQPGTGTGQAIEREDDESTDNKDGADTEVGDPAHPGQRAPESYGDTHPGAVMPPESRGRLTEAATAAERDAAVRYPSDPDASVQDAPIEQGSLDATDEQKIQGIIEQTRQDLLEGHGRSSRELLTQRFEQSAIPISDERLTELSESLHGDERH
jgi:hypothetical protein